MRQLLFGLIIGLELMMSVQIQANERLRNLQLANLNSECTTFSSDGKYLAVAFDNDLEGINYEYGPLPPTRHLPQESGIGVWDLTTGRLATWISSKQTANCIRFTPDGKKLAAVGIDSKSLHLFDLKSGDAETLNLVDVDDNIGYQLELLDAGKNAAVTTSTGKVIVFHLATQDYLHEFEGNDKEDSLLVLRGGKYLASGFRIWSLEKDQLVRSYEHDVNSRIQYSNPDVVVMSPREDLMYGFRSWSNEAHFHMWRLAENRIAHPFLIALRTEREREPRFENSLPPGQVGVGKLTDLAISKNGYLLATSGLDRKARIWHLPTQRQIAVFESTPKVSREIGYMGRAGTGMHDIEFSPDGKLLMTLCCDGDINLWDISKLDIEKAPPSTLKLARYWAAEKQIEEQQAEFSPVTPASNRPARDLAVGQRVVARNVDNQWYRAQITEVLPRGKARVHFTGYTSRLDAVLPRTRIRLP